MPPLTISTELEQKHLELAQHKHTPTKAMTAMSKRGVAASKNHKIPDASLAVGRKIAAGGQLSDDHVEAIANFHAGHEYDCTVDDSAKGVEDMVMGGAPGAAWSAARSAAIDVTSLSEDSLELGADDVLSLEIFVRDGMGEPVELADDDPELIWAPILRSGTLATRPGPYGEKLREPLIIVPGLTESPGTEIGLENLLNNFKAGAVQHVTIPTTHENGVLENNGYIVDMKIVDSTKRPGERVLVGAHKITEPDVLGRIQRGSVANRSCGILHDYVNTETGAQYDQVIEHTALTNKPWVRGMAAYGDLAIEDFSDRCIVPMMLSEAPTAPSETTTELSWDGSAGRFTDAQYQRSCLIDRKNGKPAKERCSLPVREPDGSLNPDGVHSAAGRIAALGDVSTQQKRAAAKKLIALYHQIKEDPPPNLLKLASVSTKMSETELKQELLADIQWGDEPSLNEIRSQLISQLADFRNQGEPGGYPYYYVMDVTANKALVQIEYGDPDGQDDAWVVPFDIGADSKLTLAAFSEWSPVTQQWVTDEDAARDQAELGALLGSQGLPVPTALSERETRSQLSQGRHNQQGGAMPPTTQETLDRLELSDEAKAVFQKTMDENRALVTRLAETQSQARKAAVTTRVAELQEKGFTPGFCAEYERIALGDDGQPAVVLNLSENGVARDVDHTATQLADRLIAALPFDESGKFALAGQANLVESPISGRPALSAEDAAAAAGEGKPKDGDALLADWKKADPRLIAEFEAKLAPSPTASA
jgi:hypothetical protein